MATDTTLLRMPATPSEAGIGANNAAFARQVREIVRDLMEPKPAIYWTDLLLTTAIAYASLAIYLTAPNWSLAQIAACVVAGLAFYRATVFTHEISHIPSSKFRLFRTTWNLLIGMPLMSPSFTYADHKSHHVNHSYGTKNDGEYYPLGRGPMRVIYLYLINMFVLPVLAVVRFLILAPLSVFHRGLRKWVWEQASSLAMINPHYRRPAPKGKEKLVWGLQEAGSFLFAASVVTLLVLGVLPWMILVKLYCVFALVTTLNYTRGMVSHWFVNEWQQLTYVEQMLDSLTITGNPVLTELWAPLGMRYHALHHLLPSMPYHAMGQAHRRLMRDLPADSPYRQTVRPSLYAALREFIHNARNGGPQPA
jgi:fatty acid desaturase